MVLYALCSLLLAWSLLPSFPLPALLASVLVTLWMVNLYNFMDGIDGIAALQCILACVGAALLACRPNWASCSGTGPRPGCSWATLAVCRRV